MKLYSLDRRDTIDGVRLLNSAPRRDAIYGIRLSALLILLILTLFTLTSCDNRDFNETTSSYIIVSFTANSRTLYDDGGATSVILEAVVHDDRGRAVPSQSIKFSADVTQIKFETIGTGGELEGGGVVDLFNRFQTDGNGTVRANTRLSGKVLSQDSDSLAVNISVWLNDESSPQQSLSFTLYKEPGIARIDFDSNQVPPSVIIGQRLELIARPYDSLNNPVTDGVRVSFVTTHKGWFEDPNGIRYNSQIDVSCSGGYAMTTWVTGTIAGKDTLYVKIGDISSEKRVTDIQTGTPKIIIFDPYDAPLDPDNPPPPPYVPPHPLTVPTNSDGLPIAVLVTDMYGNFINGKIVNFKSKNGTAEDAANIGDIQPSRLTNGEGIAVTTFTPGNTAGDAYITATCGDSAFAITMIAIQSVEGRALQFTNTSPIELNVQGTGGMESASISVRVLDENSNLVTTPNRIKFTVSYAPDGVMINNTPIVHNPDIDYKIVDTFGGIASVAIAAGENSGTVELRVELLNPDTDGPLDIPVVLTKNNITIQSGPPDKVNLFIPNESTAINMGAGAWKIIIGANISDTYGNPVVAGTAVNFSLINLRKARENNGAQYPPPGSTGFGGIDGTNLYSTDPLIIFGSAYVGNRSADGDSTAGVAYSFIQYHGSYTNWWVDVVIDLTTLDVPNIPVKLPMQNPTIEIIGQPTIIQWLPGETPPNTNPITWTNQTQHAFKYTTLVVKVIDGQNNRLFNVPLEFSANAGLFMLTTTGAYNNDLNSFRDVSSTTSNPQASSVEWPTEHQEDESNLASPITPFSAVTNDDGLQYKRFYYRFDLFTPAPAPPSESTGTITVQILGIENTVRTVELIFRNWNP